MYACAVLHIVQCCNRARRLEAIKICSKTTGQLALLGFEYRRQLTAGENKINNSFRVMLQIYYIYPAQLYHR